MKFLKKLLPLILTSSVAMFTGCTITQNVVPVGSGVQIAKVYVLENDKVLMEGLLDELLLQIRENDFDSESYSGARPAGAKHHITYTANWAWDMAMYLTYFELKLYENDRLIGEAKYDAKNGGGNMGKFGKTAEKIRPLLEELFLDVQRVN